MFVTSAGGPPEATPAGENLKLSNYLGILRDDPDNDEALAGLAQLVAAGDPERLGPDPIRLLEVARAGHESRGELGAVATLIEIESLLDSSDPQFQLSLYKELGRIRAEHTLQPEEARAAYLKAQELAPDDREVRDALRRLEQAESSWRKLAKRFVEEADSATDISLKTSLLVRAACLVWQYKKKGRNKETDSLFKAALELDPENTRAALLYEHTLRQRDRWKDLVALLLSAADGTREQGERINMFVRAGRVCYRKLEDKTRAAACYERVLDFEPDNSEGLEFLSQYFAETEQWDHLAGLYEDALNVRQKVEVEQGLLLQAGMVHWRMRGRPQDAEPYFARLRRTDPAHPAAIEFYRDFHDGEEGVSSLVDVLSDALRVSTDAEQKKALALEVAELTHNQENMTERAIDAWKQVVRLDPSNPRATGVLKDLYGKAHKWNALVDILKGEVEGLSEDAVDRKVELLREQASIYREYLRMDGMYLNALSTILRLKPSDEATLTELASKYREMGRYNDLIDVLTHEAEAQEDPVRRIELLLEVAGLWIEHFSNYNQATGPLEQVLELDAENRSALSQLKGIYERKRAWRPLYEVLDKERGVSSDPAARLESTVAMAKLASERLHNYTDAIRLWREVVAEDPSVPGALDALEKLADREQDHATLAMVLEKEAAEAAQAGDSEGQVKSLLKLATMCSTHLEDHERAIAAWQQVLTIEPSQGRAMRSLRDHYVQRRDWDALEGIFERTQDWEGLVDVLGTEAEQSTDPDTKIELSLRAAKVFEDRVGEPARAARSYERVLSVDPTHVAAARALVPLYEADEKWARKRVVLECLLSATGADAEQLDLLSELRTLSQERLRDGEAAFTYATRAYALAPQDDAVVAGLEAAATAAAAHDRLLEMYLERAGQVEGVDAVPVLRAAARVAAERLGRTEVAAAQYRAILAVEPADPEALGALEKIVRSGKDPASVAEVLQRRLDQGAAGEERMALLKELADLEEGPLQTPDAAAGRYREMAELHPEQREVWAALDRLAGAAERYAELADIIERRRELEDEGASVELGSRLGALCLGPLEDIGRAVDVYGQVLDLDSAHGPSTSALESVSADGGEHAPLAREMLERAYEKTGRYDKLAALLQQRLEGESNEEEKRQLRLRIAEISGSKLGDATGAYGSLEAAFLADPTDASLWDRLADAAAEAKQHTALAHAYAMAVSGDKLEEADRVDLSRRVAKLYDEVLGQKDEAEPHHRRVLSADPLDDVAFVALKELYTSGERWEDLQALYRTRIEETVDAAAKLDLLLQTCFLYEEILERPELAIEAYQAVLELEPDHGPALRTLERLYESTERWRDLAGLLRRDLDQAEGYDQLDLMYRLGQLHETKLGEPGPAVDLYEGVLTNNPTHLRSQEALTRLLAVEGLRQRIAGILEPIYESQGAYKELAEVLTIQLEGLEEVAEKVDVLMRVGELYEQRLRDPEGAFGAYARASELDPADTRAREALAEIASTREVFRRRRADVLERAVEAASGDDQLQAEILLELAVLLDEFLEEREAAERAYRRLLELDGDNPDMVLRASRALERIHAANSDQVAVAADLARQAEFEPDPQAQAALLVRLAALYEGELEQPERAVEVHRRRLELDSSDHEAMRSLEQLLERLGRNEELVEALNARAQLEEDPDTRAQLGRRIGALYEERLGDVDNAITAFSEVLDTAGPDPDTLAALQRLYERAERWEDLLDVLQRDEEQNADGDQRAELRFRMAETARLRIADAGRAIELYRSVLEQMPDHAGTLTALDTMMADPDCDERFEAARIAAPRYQAGEAHTRLLRVLDVLASADDEHERLNALEQAAQVAEDGLGDAGGAFEYLGRALRLGAAVDSLPSLLPSYARLAEVQDRFADYNATLQEIAPELYGDVQIEVYRRIAECARDRLSDGQLAREYFTKLLDERPDDRSALDALEKLTEESRDFPALIDTLKRKTELVDSPGERHRLLARQADIYERGLDDNVSAIEVLDELLIDGPSAEAYESLERLLLAEGRYEDLASAYEAQLDRGIGSAVEHRYRLAHNSHHRQGDTHQALEHLREAVTIDPGHGASVALLEQLMTEQGEYRPLAAEILEPGYLARMEWSKLTSALEARVEAEQDMEEQKRLLVRLSQIYEDQLEDFDGTMEIYARLFRADPRDEDVWDTLQRLAKVGDHWNRLAKIYASAFTEEQGVDDEIMAKLAMMTGGLFDERVGNLHQAAEHYARVVEFEPSDRTAFDALESCYKRLADEQSLLSLYRSQAEVAEDDDRRIALLHKQAALLSNAIKDSEEALRVYREILDLAPEDAAAAAAVDGLLTDADDHEALAQHLRDQVERAVGTPDEVPLKVRLAKLCLAELKDEGAAVDLLEEITQVDPSSQDAIGMLENLVQGETHRLRICQILDPLYERQGEWRKRVAIAEAQIEMLEDELERVRLLGEVAQLHEGQGGNLDLAFNAWARALELEPDNDEARGHVDRIAAALDDWDRHVAAYEKALARATDPSAAAVLLTTLARVHDEKRGDLRASISVYERLLDVDPEDTTPLDALEVLHTLLGDWDGLVKVLERKVESSFDPEERSELLRRVGKVHHELLENADKAVEAYKRATEENDADPLAWEALDGMYEGQEAFGELSPVIERRIELAELPEERAELGLRLGVLLDTQLRQPQEAITALQRVLDDAPGHREVVARLAALFEKERMWPELLDNLEQQAAVSEDPQQRVTLRCRAAGLQERELDDLAEAIECYRRALDDDPACQQAIDALMRYGQQEDFRVQVSELLEPILREGGRWDQLVALVEQGIAALSDHFERRAELERLAEIFEQGKGDASAAFDAYARALAEDPTEQGVQEQLRRLAETIPAWERYADVLTRLAGQTTDPQDASVLYRQLGQVCEAQLGDDARAIEAFVNASAQDDDATETLVDLDRLYLKTEQYEPLVDVVERRVSVAADPDERTELLNRLGELREQRLDDLQGAFVAFREVLEGDPVQQRALEGMERLGQHQEYAAEVLDILESSYREMGAMDRVVGLFDIRVQLAETEGEKLQMLQEAARMWEQELGNPQRAQQSLRKAFAVDPSDFNVLAELERLAGDAGDWSPLSGLVEELDGAGKLEGETRRELYLRAADWYRDKLGDAAHEEAALRTVLLDDSTRDDVHERLIQLLREPGREGDLVGALYAWAREASDPSQRRSLFCEAGQLSEAVLSDIDTAADCFEEALAIDPDDESVLAELLRLRRQQARHADVASLLSRQLKLTADEGERRSILHQLAETYAGPLEDAEHAIGTYQALLKQDPQDAEAATALEGLFQAGERWGELQSLLEQRLSGAEDPAVRIDLRVRLAGMAEQRFGDVDGAIGRLREVLLEEPTHLGALDELERLYSAGGRWKELVALLSRRAEQASAAQNVDAEVALLHRLCDVHEKQLRDPDSAVMTYARILERRPQDVEVIANLSRLHADAGRWAKVAELTEQSLPLLQGQEAVAAALTLADIAKEHLQDPAREEAALQAAFELDPGNTSTRDRLKALYETQGNAEALAQMLTEDVEAASDVQEKVTLLNRIANLYAKELNDPARAVGCLEQAVGLVPDDRDALLLLCDLYIAAGRQGDAIPVLEKIIESYGGRRAKEVAVYQHRLGQAYEGMGQTDEALARYDAAFKIDLTNVGILRDLGRLCLRLEDYERAQKSFRALLLQKLGADAGITKAEVYYHLGEVSLKQGDKVKAKSMLQRAVSEAGEYPEATALLESM